MLCAGPARIPPAHIVSARPVFSAAFTFEHRGGADAVGVSMICFGRSARVQEGRSQIQTRRPVTANAHSRAVVIRMQSRFLSADIEPKSVALLFTTLYGTGDVRRPLPSCRHCRSSIVTMKIAERWRFADGFMVWPAQISVDGFSVANILATRLSCSPGTHLTRSTSSGPLSTSLRRSST